MREKKDHFLLLYEPVHQSFERFCKARAYGQMPFRDLMQETILIAYDKLYQVKDPDKFLYFLFGIATRVVANIKRKVKYTDLSEVAEHNLIDLPYANRKTEIDFLYQALASLPADQRDALVYFEIVGLTVREIAGYQHKTEEAVRQSLSRGRQKLCTILKNNVDTRNSIL